MTRRLLAGVAFAFLAVASALAADVAPPRYMPPPRAPALVPFFSWNGFYVGINGGYAWGTSNWTDRVTNISTGSFDVRGGMVGGTVGYNMQWGPAVFGVETDLDWTDIHGSTNTLCFPMCETSNRYLGTARARIGYAFDRALPFISGGMAYGDIKGTSTAFTFSNTSIGWTAGGGLEYAFMPSWSGKIEYLYVDLGKATCDTVCSGGSLIEATFKANLFRAGVNYKF